MIKFYNYIKKRYIIKELREEDFPCDLIGPVLLCEKDGKLVEVTRDRKPGIHYFSTQESFYIGDYHGNFSPGTWAYFKNKKSLDDALECLEKISIQEYETIRPWGEGTRIYI